MDSLCLSIHRTDSANSIKHTFSSLDETARKVGTFVHEKIISPVSIGIKTGVRYFVGATVASTVAISTFAAFDCKSLVVDEAAVSRYRDILLSDPLSAIVTIPLAEEIVYRGFVQSAFEWLATRILPDVDLSLFGGSIKLAALVSVVGTSTLFGAVHLSNGIGIFHVVMAVVGGVTLGLLKHSHGMTASISAHMTINAMSLGLIALAQGANS
jgi:membrane protease YdiL (CAAX protease family)